MKTLKQELADRGLLYQFTSDELFKKFDEGKGSFYCGFDPTADSLHLGNFIGFMVGVHLMRRGNKYFALTGGATGMIGDPGGKDSERTFLSPEILDKNQVKISAQITGILNNLEGFSQKKFNYDFVNNKDFYVGMGYLDFLREVGKFITINVMMSKDTVKKRIEDPNQSISYTEFSYMLLQGYDFCRLFKDEGVTLQIGGQDQWGNLVTGTELIRKKYEAETFALTWPLITDSTGKKFGKSEGNAMFLDKNKTSPYFIYQYFMNTSDADIGKYMKMLTLIETEEIDKIVANHMEKPENREGQKLLAYKIVEIIHGSKEADLALRISDFMFGENDKLEILKSLSNDELNTFLQAMGGFIFAGENLFETIVKSGLESSNSNARNAVKSGAIFINEEKVVDFNLDLNTKFINDKILLLRKGKKNFRIIVK
ncbi:MAG: tyrosine--tRNA ligase [Candidatus Gracilibacteria bacterium]|nr:tyrosine--tRNA ligase [Candidatus Gracilibacteria bacterium]